MDKNDNEQNSTKTNINWYPGHMAKTKREIKEKISLIDIVYEVIDARMPKSSKVIDLDNLVNDKKRIIIMTKYDLCDKVKTDGYIKDYQSKYPVIPMNLKDNNKKDINKLISITNELLTDINEKRKTKGLKPRIYRALVVGAPNVGKSTLINQIANKNVVQTGNKAGVTKGISWIRVNKDIELLDTPGILYPKIEDREVGLNLASLTSIKEEILNKEEVATYIVTYLYHNYNDLLVSRYKLKNIDINDMNDIFMQIGNNFGCLIKGSNIDYDKVYTIIINDLKEERIRNITFD